MWFTYITCIYMVEVRNCISAQIWYCVAQKATYNQTNTIEIPYFQDRNSYGTVVFAPVVVWLGVVLYFHPQIKY